LLSTLPARGADALFGQCATDLARALPLGAQGGCDRCGASGESLSLGDAASGFSAKTRIELNVRSRCFAAGS
jgi:hypothetical protein